MVTIVLMRVAVLHSAVVMCGGGGVDESGSTSLSSDVWW